MAVPASRQDFKMYCLRKLGFPVIGIEVDDDQLEDRIDEALKYYADYHFDATECIYLKHLITANDFPDAVHSLYVANSGTGYANNDPLVFTSERGANAAGHVLTDANGAITNAVLSDSGTGYKGVPPTITITTSGGSGGSITPYMGGFIDVPDNIIGVIRAFDLTNAITNINNMFSIQYQIALNEIWSLSSYSMIPYYTTIMQLNLIQQLLVGQQPIRYSRHRNRVYLDMSWDRVSVGQYLIFECYQVIDPNEFPDVWGDRWLQLYATALFKRQWGNHLSKLNLPLPANVTFSGQHIYDEAEREIEKLEAEMITTYSPMCQIFTG